MGVFYFVMIGIVLVIVTTRLFTTKKLEEGRVLHCMDTPTIFLVLLIANIIIMIVASAALVYWMFFSLGISANFEPFLSTVFILLFSIGHFNNIAKRYVVVDEGIAVISAVGRVIKVYEWNQVSGAILKGNELRLNTIVKRANFTVTCIVSNENPEVIEYLNHKILIEA